MAADLQSVHAAMRAARAAPPWLAERQEAALARFLERGFPSLRDEDWRYTNLRALREADLDALPCAGREPDALDTNAVRLVLDPARIDVEAPLPDGVTAIGLRAAHETGHPLAARLGAALGEDVASLSDLNDAFAQDALLVGIDAGAQLAVPLALEWRMPAGERVLSSPRVLVVAGAQARATLVDNRVVHGGFCNGVTELIVEPGATLRYVDLKRERAASHNLAHTRAQVHRDARLDALSVTLGGALVRNDLHVTLAGRGAHAALYGVFIAGEGQHIDNHTTLDHRYPDTHSDEDYRGILGRMGHGVFNGKVIVRPGAQRISSAQSNDNLLLDDSAEIDTKPELQIYADDVRCSHGATIGRLDEQALFYLRSRGVGEELARRMLLDAFAARAIAAFPDAGLRATMTDLVTSFLAQGILEESP